MNHKRTVKPRRRFFASKSRIHSRVTPGAAPGTIVVNEDAPSTTISVTVFDPDEISEYSDATFSQIPEQTDGRVVWVDVIGLGDLEIIEGIGERFGIHRLSLEDVVKTHQRPKFEVFDDHLYIVTRMPHDNGDLDLEQVSVFIGQGFVVTWQERIGDCFAPVRERLRNPKRAVRENGADFLGYALVDSMIDAYFPLIAELGDRLEAIEDELSDSDFLAKGIQDVFQIRSEIRTMRRVAWSHRQMVRDWMSYDGALTTDVTRLHLRDVADHTVRIVELLESCRETCSDLRDLHLSATSMHMNEVMKVLTVIATIFIPLGFVAGLYGMNFSSEVSPWNMPETGWYFGYPIALLLMALIAVGMVVYFRRKGWIGH